MRARQQDRHALRAVDGVEARFIETRARSRRRRAPRGASSSASPESTLTLKPSRFSAATVSSRCGKSTSGWQPMSTTSPPLAISSRPRATSLRDAERRRIDDLGKDADVLLRQIGRLAVVAEELRQVDDLVGAALERHAVVLGKVPEVHAAAARHDDAIGFERLLQPVAHDVLGHQRRHLDAEVGNAPRPVRQPHGRHRLGEPRLGEAPGQEQ